MPDKSSQPHPSQPHPPQPQNLTTTLNRHPYIVAVIVAAVLAIVVWTIVPKEYAAITKVSDEYKEVDIAIGLDKLTANIRKSLISDNEGINDIEVYCKALKTEDFARHISRVQVPGKKMTYGEWVMADRHFWQPADTVDIISDNIEYNISTRQSTLTVQFADRDPLVASQMLDSTIFHLQAIVTDTRHQEAEVALKNAEAECNRASEEYKKASEKYSSYSDSHFDASLEDVSQQEKTLEEDAKNAYQYYEKASKEYARQKALLERNYCSFAVITPNEVPVSDTSHPFVYFCVLALLSVTGIKGYKLYCQRKREHCGIEFGGMFSPWSISLMVWGGMGAVFLLSSDILDPLESQFYIAIAIWLPILVITSFVTFNLLRHDSRPLPTEGIEINKYVFYFFFILAVVLSPMYMYKVYQTVSMFDSKDMMKNMRDLAVHGEGQGFLNYAIVIAQSLLLVAMWRCPKIPLWQVLVIICCCVLNSLAIMEKGSTFLVILCGMYVLFERKVIRIRTILAGGAVTLLAFYFFNLMREGEDSDYAKNESLLDFIGMYVLSPPVAFCRVRQEVTTQFGTNTLETIYLFLERFGIGHYAVHEKTQEFVFVPISTNVYTIMQPFFRDFGYLGIAFFSWIYGLVSGVLYRYSCNGNVFCICLYTYMVEVLVLQFYQENLFMSMVFVLQLVVFVFLLTQNVLHLGSGGLKFHR